MKSKIFKIKKDFDAVEMMREIRDKISKDIMNMSFAEIKEYFKKRKEHFTNH